MIPNKINTIYISEKKNPKLQDYELKKLIKKFLAHNTIK